MIQLYYRPSGSQTIAIWPEIDSIYYNNISGSFILDYSQDLDRSSGSIDLTLQNTPDSVSPRLVFSLANANVPQFTGYYTVELFERIGARLATWGETTDTWIAADYTWNATTDIVSSRQLDTDRAWISGSDDSSFTQYASANEDGQYTTYHG